MSAERKLLTEPVARPDGISFKIEQVGQSVIVDVEGIQFGYTREEVTCLGLGDFQSGVAKIGQSAFLEDRNQLLKIGSRRILAEELTKS